MRLRRDLTDSFVTGALAGTVAASVAVLGRFAVESPTFFDLTENWITGVMPSVVFAFLLDHLMYAAKPLLFVGVLVAQILAGGVLGISFYLIAQKSPFHRARHRLAASILYGGI